MNLWQVFVRLLLLNAGPIAHLSSGNPNLPLVGEEMSDFSSLIYESGKGLFIDEGEIVKISDSKSMEDEFSNLKNVKKIDCKQKAIIPGFVDSHTHLLWSGDRSNEMSLRQSGFSYKEIANRGGGINQTVNSTRKATKKELIELGNSRLRRALNFGTTTMECKSGYGLDTESELKILESINLISKESPVKLHSTWLGAHDIPTNLTKDEYIEELLSEQIPAIVEQNVAKWVDVFCEPGWFSVEDTETIVNEAKRMGLEPRLHVDEFEDGEGLRLAAELEAISADHVAYSSDEARQYASDSGTMQTFLPGTPYVLGKKLDLPLRKCIDNKWPISLATDFNPNCRTISIPFIGSLATHRMGMSPLEALCCVTRNPATTLFSKGDSHVSGSIRIGGPADILILNSKYVDSWCQMPGDNPVEKIISKGKLYNHI